ncbi:hypothetical protein [Cupriavidus basilensis]|uniref:hypothetical protein n=1 Tax=Cupriavidus basilensis TaxID=68895 RepID=UPI0039F6BAFA
MSRAKLLMIWVLCVVACPFLLVGMLCESLGGSQGRALNMAVGFDCSANGLLGGPENQTISTRTGNALILGARWARIAAPCIDFLFGAGHCLSNATIKPT